MALGLQQQVLATNQIRPLAYLEAKRPRMMLPERPLVSLVAAVAASKNQALVALAEELLVAPLLVTVQVVTEPLE